MRPQAAFVTILFLLALLSCTLVSRARAQYMFLDSNADTISLGDALESLDTPTTVSVWIITNQMRDGSPAICPSMSDSMTINSYEVILHASGGRVSYESIVNHVEEMSTQFGFASDSTDLYVGFGGGTALPPGKYLLCTLEITGVNGNPTIEIAPTTPLSGAYLTSFGSQCPGAGGDNTLKLGTDWSDVDGLAGAEGLSISLSVPEQTTLPVGNPITIDASVDGVGDGLTLEASSIPPGASTSFGPDGRSASLHWVPLNADAGNHTITFRAHSESDSAERSTTVVVPSSGSEHPVRASSLIRYLAEVGANSGEPRVEVINGEERVGVFLESGLTDQELDARGVKVRTRSENHMTASCLRDSLSSLLLSEEIGAITEPPLCELSLDYSAASAGVEGLRTHSNNSQIIQGDAGQGVIVGIVDSGIDVTHPDFKNLDGTSRILAYWDQMTCGSCLGIPGTSPAWPYDIGREWTPSPSESLFYQRASTYSPDVLGHGTWVAGIAAGNANFFENGSCSNNRYLGVAPRADIIAVKLQPIALLDDRYPSDKIVDAVAYIIAKAKALNKRAVINLSLGSQYGPHDGQSQFEGMLSSHLHDAGPGYVVVASVGNDALNGLHGVARATDPVVAKRAMILAVPDYSGNLGRDSIEVFAWFDTSDSVAVKVVSPNDSYFLGPVGFPGQDSKSTPHAIISIDVGAVLESEFFPYTFPPFGAHILLRAQPNERIEPGNWKIEFTPASGAGSVGGDGRVDGYITRRNVGNPVNFARMVSQLPEDETDEAIRMPASADSVIGVGAYISRACYLEENALGSIVHCPTVGPGVEATYWPSSRGPRRDGVIKPDIVAPGAVIVGPLSKDASFAEDLRVQGGGYVALHGTSGAAPHVTGAVALLLMEAAHTASSARRKLQESAVRADPFVSATPNKVWGWGKLNVRKAVAATTFSLEVLAPRPGYSFPGYPFHAGVQESVTVRVTGAGTDANGVSLELVPGTWCYSPATLLGSTPQLAANQSHTFRFTIPTSFSEDSVRVRATASAGTLNGRSAWTRFQHRVVVGAATGIEEEASTQAARLSLRLGSANPAGRAFGFRLAVPHAGEVAVKVFSVTGRLVWEHKAMLQAPGEFKFGWDGTDMVGRRVGSGVYLLQATAGRDRILKKLVLMK